MNSSTSHSNPPSQAPQVLIKKENSGHINFGTLSFPAWLLKKDGSCLEDLGASIEAIVEDILQNKVKWDYQSSWKMSMPFALPSTSFLHIPQQIELTSLLHS